MNQKYVVCDASPLISLSESCLISILENQYLHASFLITPRVKYEAIDYPIHKKSYSFSAFRVKRLLEKGILVLDDADIQDEMRRVLHLTNTIFSVGNRSLKLVHEGEAEMLALAHHRRTPYLFMDERTTRMMIESIDSLHRHLEVELRRKVVLHRHVLEEFLADYGSMRIFRSSELLITAWKKGYFHEFGNSREALEAALFKIKFSGCALSFAEIEEFFHSLPPEG